MVKLESTIKKPVNHKAKNRKEIESNKILQEKLLNEYYDDIKELGQNNIEACKN